MIIWIIWTQQLDKNQIMSNQYNKQNNLALMRQNHKTKQKTWKKEHICVKTTYLDKVYEKWCKWIGSRQQKVAQKQPSLVDEKEKREKWRKVERDN